MSERPSTVHTGLVTAFNAALHRQEAVIISGIVAEAVRDTAALTEELPAEEVAAVWESLTRSATRILKSHRDLLMDAVMRSRRRQGSQRLLHALQHLKAQKLQARSARAQLESRIKEEMSEKLWEAWNAVQQEYERLSDGLSYEAAEPVLELTDELHIFLLEVEAELDKRLTALRAGSGVP